MSFRFHESRRNEAAKASSLGPLTPR
jgi:hypothetical protein